jgi:UDP-glucuronate 4-epimerase
MGNRPQKKALRIVVTGAAGFIGSHLCERLLDEGHSVVGLDNFDAFYARAIKEENLAGLRGRPGFELVEGDILDSAAVERVLRPGVDAVIHLAALAGVRPSVTDPERYYQVNVLGTLRLLESAAKLARKPAFVMASSSSVYGNPETTPLAETMARGQPLSPYAGSKAAAELCAFHANNLHRLTTVCLRFFTVIGPRQRPDLMVAKFCGMIERGEEISVYGDGSSARDYTYIGDIVDGVVRATDWAIAHPGAFEVFNLGNCKPVSLNEALATIEAAVGAKARLKRLPPQPEDPPITCASIDKSRSMLGYEPRTPFAEGVRRYVEWALARKPVPHKRAA